MRVLFRSPQTYMLGSVSYTRNGGYKMGKNEYVGCPLCGFNKVLRSSKRGYYQWPSFDVKSALLLQVREGGGKKAGTGATGRGKAPGSGFHLVEEESLSFAEMVDNSEYSGILSQMKEQLLTIIKQSLELGFISEGEWK